MDASSSSTSPWPRGRAVRRSDGGRRHSVSAFVRSGHAATSAPSVAVRRATPFRSSVLPQRSPFSRRRFHYPGPESQTTRDCGVRQTEIVRSLPCPAGPTSRHAVINVRVGAQRAAACADDEPPMAATTERHHHRHHNHHYQQLHYDGGHSRPPPATETARPQLHQQQQQHHHRHPYKPAAKKLRSLSAAGGGGKKKSSGVTASGNRRRRVIHVLTGIVLGLFAGFSLGGGSYDRLRFYAGCGGRESAGLRSSALRPLQTSAPTADAAFAADNGTRPEIDSGTPPESLLFVGVMTANRYLSTRAAAVHDTWARRVPGRVMFYSSEGSVRPAGAADLPLVPLPTVDDSYPPQKKSFLMLQHMWDNYGDAYEWFMRADDDVYVRPDRLAALLRSVDSRKPVFIGQAGRGNQEEFGLLSLEYDENFCMGGPGVIMSRETLARVVPHIKHCLRNLFTAHEDVELGRCVQKYAGVSCTWSYEVTSLPSLTARNPLQSAPSPR